MAYRVFTLPVHDPGAAETELNGFLASRFGCCRSIDGLLKRASVRTGHSAWISSMPGEARHRLRRREVPGSRDRTDYREVLNAEDFAVFAKLREIRKAIVHANTSHPRTDLFRTMTFSGRRPNSRLLRGGT